MYIEMYIAFSGKPAQCMLDVYVLSGRSMLDGPLQLSLQSTSIQI
jgi:hypothetical protein